MTCFTAPYPAGRRLQGLRPPACGGYARTEQHQLDALESAAAILLGASTYRLFAAYWPTADPAIERIAAPINALPKYVVSSSLRDAPWGEYPPAQIRTEDGVAVARSLTDAMTATDGARYPSGHIQLDYTL